LFFSLALPETTAFADTVKDYIEECKDVSFEGMKKYSRGNCMGMMRAMMKVGPFLIPELRFCPPDTAGPIWGVGK
jgi:hypothetical protein